MLSLWHYSAAKKDKIMKKKFLILSVITFILALAIFAFSFFLYHFVGPNGEILSIPSAEPGKPMVTLLFGVWGTCFLFSSVMSLLVALIFFPCKKSNL